MKSRSRKSSLSMAMRFVPSAANCATTTITGMSSNPTNALLHRRTCSVPPCRSLRRPVQAIVPCRSSGRLRQNAKRWNREHIFNCGKMMSDSEFDSEQVQRVRNEREVKQSVPCTVVQSCQACRYWGTSDWRWGYCYRNGETTKCVDTCKRWQGRDKV
jgi:hypothetical protein